MDQETMTKREAYIAYRVLTRMHEIIHRNWEEGRIADSMRMSRTIGALQFHIYGWDCIGDLYAN